MTLALQRVTFQVLGSLTQYFAGLNVVFHDRLHSVALDRANNHADGAAVIGDHDRPAPFVDELVLLDPTPPDLVSR